MFDFGFLKFFFPFLLAFAEDATTQTEEDSTAQTETETQEEGDKDDTKDDTKTTSWRDMLPDEIRDHPVFEKYKEPSEVFKAFVEAQKLIGKKGVIVPDPKAPKEEWDKFFEKLGRPKDAEGYKLPEIELPEDIPMHEELIEDFKETAHELGLLPHQVEGLYKWYMETNKSIWEDIKRQREEEKAEAEAQLRKEWGKAYNEKLQLAQKLIEKYADPELVDLLDEGLGNDPRLIKFLANIAEKFSEDVLEGSPKRLTMTPEEAKAEINRMMADKNHPLYEALHDEYHPLHKQAVEKKNWLYKLAYPEGGQR